MRQIRAALWRDGGKFCLVLAIALSGVICRAAEKPKPRLENSLLMKFAYISPGTFLMGSDASEEGRRPDELQREVRLTRGYYLGQFEVTRGNFEAFVRATEYKTEIESNGRGGYGVDSTTGALLGPDPRFSWRHTGFEQNDVHPVVNVTWNDAVAFCSWLSEKEDRTYRLPTEAEWEYACRGGTTTRFCNGDEARALRDVGNISDARFKKVYPDRNAIETDDGHIYTAPVGRYRPNAFGLYDMHGNVWEWTADWYTKDLLPGPQVDPVGPADGAERVIKGGDWYHDETFARCASRYPIPPTLSRRHAGFRILREVGPQDTQ
jgi:formylglycine-generating enzyme required for sulfatase activity